MTESCWPSAHTQRVWNYSPNQRAVVGMLDKCQCIDKHGDAFQSAGVVAPDGDCGVARAHEDGFQAGIPQNVGRVLTKSELKKTIIASLPLQKKVYYRVFVTLLILTLPPTPTRTINLKTLKLKPRHYLRHFPIFFSETLVNNPVLYFSVGLRKTQTSSGTPEEFFY